MTKKIEKILKNLENLENSWQNFLKLDTYLVYNEKEKFNIELNKPFKIPWYLRLFSKVKIDENRENHLERVQAFD